MRVSGLRRLALQKLLVLCPHLLDAFFGAEHRTHGLVETPDIHIANRNVEFTQGVGIHGRQPLQEKSGRLIAVEPMPARFAERRNVEQPGLGAHGVGKTLDAGPKLPVG